MFSTFEIYRNRIQNMGRSYKMIPIHQVRTIKGLYKQTMKSLTIFADYISLKQAIGYMSPPSQNSRLSNEGERDQIIRVRHMGY